VTFQIGIVGLDGVLLASDCQHVSGIGVYGANEPYIPYKHSSMSSKLYWSGGEIGCCPSGNDYSDIAAQYCINHSSEQASTKQLLHDACHLVLKMAKNQGSSIDQLQGSLLLVRRDHGRSELWAADIQDAEMTEEIIVPKRPRLIHNHVWSGDRANPTVFFIERYFQGRADLSIDDLAFVAAYVVNTAAKLNDAGIRGMEILLCPHGTKPFEVVSEEKIMALIERSEQLDREIGMRLGIVPQCRGHRFSVPAAVQMMNPLNADQRYDVALRKRG